MRDTAKRDDQASQHELTAHPHARAEYVQTESDDGPRVGELRVVGDGCDRVHLLTLPVRMSGMHSDTPDQLIASKS